MKTDSSFLSFTQYVGIIVCFSLLVAVNACTPYQNGKRVGKDYCRTCTGFDDYESVSQYVELKNKARDGVVAKYDAFLQKYAQDSVKTGKFLQGYHAAVSKHNAAFTAAYENMIRFVFKTTVWYRDKDPNKYYLYSFADDSLNVLSCKEKIAYTLRSDSLYFADSSRTTAVVNFVSDTLLSLTNAKDTLPPALYRKARFEDLLRGTWTYRSEKNVLGKWRTSWTNHKENGRYVGQEWQYGWFRKTAGTYSLKQVNDSTYRLIYDKGKNGLDGVIVMPHVDTFRYSDNRKYSEVRKRSKRGSLKELSFLF